MKFPFFRNNSSELLKQAEEKIAYFQQQRSNLLNVKEQKLKRQVELWSILTPSTDTEDEYKQVSKDVAELLKKIEALDQHLDKLRIDAYHCKNGNCKQIIESLKVDTPAAGITFEVPKVEYKNSSV